MWFYCSSHQFQFRKDNFAPWLKKKKKDLPFVKIRILGRGSTMKWKKGKADNRRVMERRELGTLKRLLKVVITVHNDEKKEWLTSEVEASTVGNWKCELNCHWEIEELVSRRESCSRDRCVWFGLEWIHVLYQGLDEIHFKIMYLTLLLFHVHQAIFTLDNGNDTKVIGNVCLPL